MSVTGGEFFPSSGEYHVTCGLDHQRFEKFTEKMIIIHPGPMNQGLEISAEATDSPRAVVIRQVSDGASAHMTAPHLLLTPEGHSYD